MTSVEELLLGTRKIRPNPESMTGFIVSRQGYPIETESKLERNAYRLLDLRPDVKHITAQPDIGIRYIPDALVETTRKNLLVEVKYESDLVEKWEKHLEKFEAEEDFCSSHDLHLCFMTDHIVDLQEEELTGILAGIRSCSDVRPDEGLFESISEVLTNETSISVRELLGSLGKQGEENRWGAQVGKYIWMGNAFVVSVPSLNFLDAVISPATRPVPLPAYSLEQLRSRVETHPLRNTGGFRIAA